VAQAVSLYNVAQAVSLYTGLAAGATCSAGFSLQ
jgi:hypothetical protein